MRRLFLLYRQNIFTASLVFVLFSWALTSTIFGIRKTDKLILLKMGDDGVQIVDANHAIDDLVQVKTFLRRYVQLMYNYDYLSFEENVNKVSFILSDPVWIKVHSEIPTAKKSIELTKTTQTSAIIKLSRFSSNTFEVVIQTTITKLVGEIRNSQDQKFKLKINLIETKRSLENPWGMEVADAMEERLM